VKTDYLKSEILSKFVSDETDPPAVRRTRAIFKWLCTERENEATNERLLMTPDEYNILPRVSFGSFVEVCRDIISGIIGDTVPEEALIGSFSGGASTSRNRTKSHPARKYLGQADVTSRCLAIWEEFVSPQVVGWLGEGARLRTNVVPGNVLFTVPKKTDIDRCACKEPDLNMFVQKGIGKHFRACLRRTGINLNDQSINRSLAREGSLSGRLATLDLSSASDSVSSGLVELLLPECWYTFLDAVRCQVTIIDGEEHRNHMFSSMGNGFTFELESLLFLALARTTAFFTKTRGVVSVYGDDIICPTDLAAPLEKVLTYMGFQLNADKSFSSGPFRESCGGHYWNGLDITPFYVREPIKYLDQLIDIANKLRQWATVEGLSVLDFEVEGIWFWLKSFVPSQLWGGWDTSFKYQLVSDDDPDCRLQPVSDSSSTGEGGFYHWLNATWDRSDGFGEVYISPHVLPDYRADWLKANQFKPGDYKGVQTSKHVRARDLFRVRRVRTHTVKRPFHVFLHEIHRDDRVWMEFISSTSA